MEGLNLFIPITKVDVEKRLVFGRLAEESPDSIGEIFDYESSKPYYQEWSSFFQKRRRLRRIVRRLFDAA